MKNMVTVKCPLCEEMVRIPEDTFREWEQEGLFIRTDLDPDGDDSGEILLEEGLGEERLENFYD